MTRQLTKAILIRLKQVKGTGKNAKTRIEPDDKGGFAVQFNPTTLRVTQQNNVDEGGATTLTQRRQNPSTQSATLSFDLEFDTAEESDDNGGPVDVRTRTAIIRQFAEPSVEAPKDPPPLLKFLWGTFTFVGIVTQLTEELDYFSPEGRPLRAKVAVSMKEMRLDIEAKAVGAAARTGSDATPPGKPNRASGTPGSRPARNPDTAARAQQGESLQQLLARLNADPATWRAAMEGLSSPLGLAAGAQVQLTAGASAGLGLGVTGGFAAGTAVRGTASLAGALGVDGGISANLGISAGLGISADIGVSGGAAAGFALAEGGGVAASARVVATAQVNASVSAARDAFEVPAVRAGAGIGARLSGGGTAAPPIDPRTQSFGRGVPLRLRAGGTATAS